MIGGLDLTLRFGPVVVPDAVEIETTYDRSRPYADEIASWLDANRKQPGRNRWVERPSTDVGELLKMAIETGRLRPRNVGEHAIVNWLADRVGDFAGPAMVVYERGKIPNILRAYVDLEITAGEAADRLGPGTAIVDVILDAKRRFGRLPDRRDAFTEGEYRRALKMLGLG